MKERKFKEKYILRSEIDPKSGHEKRIPVYCGEYYCLPEPFRRRSAYFGDWMVCSFLYWALWLAYLFAGTPSAACMYVMPLAACGIFPGIYLVMGLAGTLRTPDKMNVIQKEKGIGRVYHSFCGCMAVILAASVGDIVFICVGGQIALEWIGLTLLIACGASALMGCKKARNIYFSLQQCA